ncbi:hypothetical protein BX600DRAFT_554109 [Xylariales sp. PMI_506]|nr:hypothetical protein BX600DRAFT_554109 [Xylariales sp. PMI_506]
MQIINLLAASVALSFAAAQTPIYLQCAEPSPQTDYVLTVIGLTSSDICSSCQSAVASSAELFGATIESFNCSQTDVLPIIGATAEFEVVFTAVPPDSSDPSANNDALFVGLADCTAARDGRCPISLS